MRALIVSDVHSNLEALQAVISDAEARGGFDEVWCLGDTVGYGPDPGACLHLLRSYPFQMVAGNHDYAAVGKMSVETFNYAAATAARWTSSQLNAADADFLSGLPLVITLEPFTLVHGSLRAPIWEYLLDSTSALGTFELLSTRYCLVGHSHIPFLCRENRGDPRFEDFGEGAEFKLKQERLIVNPGSVGQPRDHDPRPSYALFEDQENTLRRYRVSYDIKTTQGKMRQAQLPDPLILRLDHGT
jgi:predicted phosphodiesterase